MKPLQPWIADEDGIIGDLCRKPGHSQNYDVNRNPYWDVLDVAQRKAYWEYYLKDSE